MEVILKSVPAICVVEVCSSCFACKVSVAICILERVFIE